MTLCCASLSLGDPTLSFARINTPAGLWAFDVSLSLTGAEDSIAAEFTTDLGSFNQTTPAVADQWRSTPTAADDPEDTRFLLPNFNPGTVPPTILRFGLGPLEDDSRLDGAFGTLGGTIGSGHPIELPLARLVFGEGQPTTGNVNVVITQKGGIIALSEVIPYPQPSQGDCNESGAVDALDLSCVNDVETRDVILNALDTLLGDLDGDGQVDFKDFLQLSANFNKHGSRYDEGNIDLDESVGFSDFLILSANFNARRVPNTVGVPEPASWQLLSLAIGLCFARPSKRPRAIRS